MTEIRSFFCHFKIKIYKDDCDRFTIKMIILKSLLLFENECIYQDRYLIGSIFTYIMMFYSWYNF